MGTMKFSQALDVLPRLSPKVAVLIRGEHGIGKSSIVKLLQKVAIKRFAEKNNGAEVAYPLLDKRIGQMTEGDMMGLPKIVEINGTEVTSYRAPDFIRVACEEASFLFLDELNRASREVQNIGFQLCLDRETSNGAKLHPQTYVYAAINTGAMYQVNRMDPALLDRFFVIDLLFDEDEWLQHAREEGLASTWLDFLTGERNWIGVMGNANPNEKGTSPRSAFRCGEELAELLREGDARRGAAYTGPSGQAAVDAFYERNVIKHIVAGFMGTECSSAFDGYLKELSASTKTITGEEVFENYVDLRNHIDLTRPDVMTAVVDKWLAYTEHNIKSVKDMTVTERQGENFAAILRDLPKDHRVPFYQKLLAYGMPRVDFLKAVHPYGVALLLEVFGTVPGEDGIGMLPTNPGAVIREGEEDAAQ